MKKTATEVVSLAKDLFSLLGVDGQVEATSEKTAEGEEVTLTITAGEDAGLLIGKRGETLSAIQSFLGMAVNKPGREGGWTRVVLDIDGWKEKQEDKLKALAEQAATRAKETGSPQYLYNLDSAQRRIVHLALKDDTAVKTESEGEGRERHLVVTSAS